MPLTFAGIVPHPPVLIPTIGKDKGLGALDNTVKAMATLEEELYLSKPHTIIIISPHEGRFEDAFVVNAHTEFTARFDEYGDAITESTYHGAPDLAAKIAHIANSSGFPVRLISDERISHGTSVPLHALTNHLPDIKILPVGFSGNSVKEHVAFGELLKNVIMDSPKRIAVISSGDMSHTLSENAPAGFDEQGAAFDRTLIDLLTHNNVPGIMQMDAAMVEASQACGYRTLLILLGIIKNMNFTFEQLSYEHPFGVGYLVGNIHV